MRALPAAPLLLLLLLLLLSLLLLLLLLLLFGYCLGKERYARPWVTSHSTVPWVLPRVRPHREGEISLILGQETGDL